MKSRDIDRSVADVRVLGARRLPRAALLGATALTATAWLVLAAPATAQPAPSARPLGGVVTAGAASISTTASATNIDQSSNRAAINWSSFDVGSAQSVNFNQPNSGAVTLNRVTGPDPSAIAGQIHANGQIIITNAAGVVFSKGAQVNAQSLVVSTAGITNQNFMAGRMAFDQAGNPGARIANSGTITVQQAGLAALVAPGVANAGVINAHLGHVVLAGARTATLDLYGDGLVSLDVSSQVQAGPGGATALVTNSGTILADGGTVQLTAAAADGVLQTLVDAGGVVRADTSGASTGRIAITGTGGAVIVDGRVAADGLAAGQAGGTIEVAGNSTTIAPAGLVSAAGASAGGTIAIGTTPARAIGSGTFPTGTSAVTTIAAGARVAADGSGRGRGGRVTVLSTRSTVIAGELSAQGGSLGGDGGVVELSGEAGFVLTGRADTSAAHGALGSIVLDPTNLTIVPDSGVSNIVPGSGDPSIGYADTPAMATVRAADLEALEGDITLQAVNDLTVAASLTLTQNLTLEAGHNVTVNGGVTIGTPGTITLTAADANIPGFDATGAVVVRGTLDSTGLGVRLSAGSGGILIGGAVTASSDVATLQIDTPGGTFSETGAGAIDATDLEGEAGAVSLLSTANAIPNIANPTEGSEFDNPRFAVNNADGDFMLVDSVDLTVGGFSPTGGITVPTDRTITLVTDSLTLGPVEFGSRLQAGDGDGTIAIAPFTPGTEVELTDTAKPAGILSLSAADLGLTSAGTLQLGSVGAAGIADTAGSIVIGEAGQTIDLGADGYAALTVQTGGAVGQGGAGELAVGTFGGTAGNLAVLDVDNFIGTLAGLATTAGNIAFHTGSTLDVTGPVVAQGGLATVSLSSAGGEMGGVGMTLAADIDGSTVSLDSTNGSLAASAGIVQTAGVITAGTLIGAGFAADLPDANHVATTGSFATFGTFALTDATGLVIAGPLGAGAIDLVSGAGLGLAGNITTGGDASLTATGAIDQTGGTLSAGTLTGSAAGAAFGRDGNAIGTLGSFTSSADFLLMDAAPVVLTATAKVTGGGTLTIADDDFGYAAATGTLSALGGTVALRGYSAGADINFGGTSFSSVLPFFADTLLEGSASTGQVTAHGSIDLGGVATLKVLATGLLTEAPGSGIEVGTLTGTTGAVALDGANRIGALGAFTTTIGDFSLSTNTLDVAGALSAAGAVSLHTTGDLDVTAALSAPGGLALVATGTIGEAGGVISTSTLTGSAGAAADLAGANLIGSLGSFTTGGALTLENAAALGLGGVITAPSVAFDVAGALTQTAGALQVGTLSGSAAGIALGALGNQVGTLGSLASTGDLSLTDAAAVSIAGLVAAGPGRTLSLADNAPGFAAGGTLMATGGTVALAEYTAGNGVTLGGGGGITPVVAQTLRIGTAGGGPISFTGSYDLSSVAILDLLSSGAITETASAGIDVGLLTGIGAGVTLTGVNRIASLGDFASSGDFQLDDAIALAVAGTVSTAAAGTLSLGADTIDLAAGGVLSAAGGTVAVQENTPGAGISLVGGGPAPVVAQTLQVGSATGGPVSIGGVFNLSGVALVDLQSAGAIVETAGGGLDAALLQGTAASATLTGANRIDALGAFTTTGTFSLADAVGLAVDGPLNASAASVATAGALTLDGNVTTLGVLDLTAAGSITQSGGTIAAGELAGTASGAAFASSGNSIAELGDFASSGNLSLVDGAPLVVTGAAAVTGGGTLALVDDAVEFGTGGSLAAAGGTVALRNATPGQDFGLTGQGLGTPLPVTAATLLVGGPTTDDIAFSGLLDLSGVGRLDVQATGVVGDGPGSGVAVATLTGNAGSVDLVGGNAIGTLAGFSSAGGFSLASGSLDVAGPLQAASAALSVAGDLTLGGPVTVPGSLTLAATGSIEQTAGALLVGTLGGAAGSADLLGGNAIGTLAGFTSVGGFSLASGSLDVAGPVQAASAVLSVAGDLTLGGAVTVPGSLTLAATGSIAQTAGTLSVGSLSGHAGTTADLGAAGNTVAALGDFASSGGFVLADAQPLAVTGTVSVATGDTLSIADDAPSFAGGTLMAAGGTVALAEYTPGLGVTLSDLGGLGTAPVVANTLLIGTTAGGPISLQGALDLADVPVLDLQSAGAVSEAAGAGITVATLEGTAASASLGGVNAVGTLGAFTTVGSFSLADVPGLTLAGPLAAGAATLGVGGDLAIDGTVTVPGRFSAASGGAIGQTGGVLSVGTLSGSAASVNLGAANAIGTLADFDAGSGALALNNVAALTLAGTVGAGDMRLTAPAVTFAGNLTATSLALGLGGTARQTAGAITLGTLAGAAGVVDLGQAGTATIGVLDGFSAGGSLTLADAGSLSIDGGLAAPRFTIGAVGTLTLDGGTISTDGIGTPFDGSVLGVAAGTDGLGHFVQTGTSTLIGFGGTAAALEIALPGSGGTASFADLQAGGQSLALVLGSGRATGMIDAGALAVSGSGGGAALNGTVAGATGGAAAIASSITPAIDPAYLFNDCEIGAASCGGTGTFTVTFDATLPSVIRPDVVAEDLSLTALPLFLPPVVTFETPDPLVSDDQGDATLLLPNISDRDY